MSTPHEWSDSVNAFWKRVRKAGPNECWEWSGARSLGYGQITVDGKLVGAHRFSYELHNGPFLPWYCVLHRCDNRACVNPEHLYLGDYLQNAVDRTARSKGKQCSGLVPDDIVEIRRAYSTGEMSQVALSKKYGITQANVSNICSRKTWRQV